MLVARARRGDEQAFTALMSMYQERVLRVILHIVGNPEDAQDLCQETFVRLYTTFGRFDPSRAFAPWLYRIATNLCLDFLRRRKARPQTLQLDPELDLRDARALGDSPEGALLRKESRQAVMGALQKLPANYRTALVLRYVDDLEYPEIASILGISEANVQMRVSRGRQRLRELLKKLSEENV